MRVLFDGYWWVHGPGANRTVMREFVLAWIEKFPDDEIYLAVRASHAGEAADIPVNVHVVFTRAWPQAVSNAVELPLLARKVKADVTIAHNYAPMARTSVVFVHDLMFLERPQWFSLLERVYLRPMPWTLRRATAIATSSETEAARIRRLVPHAPPAQAVGLAVTTELSEAKPLRPENAPPGGFALVVGRLNVRKNLANAVEAAGMATSITPSRPLVVVGDTAHSGKSTAWDETADALINDGTVVLLGRVTNAELRWLYEHASVTLCVSLDEGFGLPPLEAASFGSPLVVSDIPVFHEILGESVTFVDQLSPKSIAVGIDMAIESAPGRAPKYEGIAETYNWQLAVDRMRQAAIR